MRWRLALAGLSLALAAGAGGVEPRAWAELDIVPMPKDIRLTGQDLALDPGAVTLVTGPAPCRQSVIGAEWINRRLAEAGDAAPLPVAPGLPASGTAVLVGTPADNPLVADAVREGLVAVGEGNPGPRGYEIRRSADGRRIVLAGADPLGALYACVTFGELVEQRGTSLVWRAAEVRDWPDIIHVTMGGDFVGSAQVPELKSLFAALRHHRDPPPELRARYLEAVRARYDWMLRRKITSMSYPIGHLQGLRWTPQPGDGGSVIREGIEYGRERGIGALVFSVTPFVGRTNFFGHLKGQALPPGRYPDWIRAWGLDDARRETAENLAVVMNHFGITDLAFHDTDAGGLDNPAQWNDRPEADRARWGDDYEAATAHIFRQYYDAFRKLAPDIRLHATLYPYVVEVLCEDTGEWYLRQPYAGGATGPNVRERARAYQARYERFWRRMHELMPPDMTFCARESFAAPTAAFRTITRGRAVFTFFGLQAKTFLAESCRWTGMFYREHDDFIFTTFADTFVPLNSLAVREYAWNTATPGAAPFPERAPTSELYTLVLPRLVRNLFGRRAAPYVLTAVSEPLKPAALAALKDAAALEAQAAMAARGARALDDAWALMGEEGGRLGMDDYAFRRFVALREIVHGACWVAGVRGCVIRARERALAQDAGAARAALEGAAARLEEARAGRERLLAERPHDPVLGQDDANQWSSGWRAGMADRVDLDPLAADLVQVRGEQADLLRRGAVPAEVLAEFTAGRTLRAAPAPAPIAVDGVLDEPAWAGAPPVECFLAPGSNAVMARADTRVRLLHDAGALYAGFEAWPVAGTPVADQDTVEVFLAAPGLGRDYVHFMIAASGRVRQQYNRPEPEAGPPVRDNAWQCPGLEAAVRRGPDRWTAELSVPLASLRSAPGPGWTVNLVRACPLDRGREVSMILRPGSPDAHAVERFAPLLWEPGAGYAPSCTIDIRDLEIGSVTVRDRIAPEARFGLVVHASQILHAVRVDVAASDAGGEWQGVQEIARSDRLFYHWQTPEPVRMLLPERAENSRLRVRVSSEEGDFELDRYFKKQD